MNFLLKLHNAPDIEDWDAAHVEILASDLRHLQRLLKIMRTLSSVSSVDSFDFGPDVFSLTELLEAEEAIPIEISDQLESQGVVRLPDDFNFPVIAGDAKLQLASFSVSEMILTVGGHVYWEFHPKHMDGMFETASLDYARLQQEIKRTGPVWWPGSQETT